MRKNNIIKAKKGQQLNLREAKLINDGAVEGLLVFDVRTRGGGAVLTYCTDGLIGLREFLQMTDVSKRLFVVLLRNVAVALRSVEENKLSRDLVILDTSMAYVDPSSWHVYLTYVPLQPYDAAGNLKTFLQQFVAACNFVFAQDVEYVQEFVEDLNSGVSYTVSKLEDFCNKISEQLIRASSAQESAPICPKCSSKLQMQETACPYCGTKVQQHAAKSPMAFNSSKTMPAHDDAVCTFDAVRMNDRQKVISVNEDDNGVVTVFRGSSNSCQTIWLENRGHAGKVLITKFPFRIGKMEGASDHRIYSNNVSRKHADIIKEQGRYYVVDLGSTNGTYLNGARIQAGVKEPLNDGAILRFADIEFKVHID